jgi:hypothetical protein
MLGTSGIYLLPVTVSWAQILSWFGRINRMPDTSTVKKIRKWKPFTGRPVGRPKSRWEDDVRNGLKKMKHKMDRTSPRSPEMERYC